jgi:tRNA (cytidine/uridine-2'-O-)-methyltransferase
MRSVLYQPDIPQNVGAIMRLGACLNVAVDVIEPCGFLWDDRRVRRAGMDYMEIAQTVRHTSWAAYLSDRAPGRLILLTTRATTPYVDFAFRPDDHLLFGRESAGVPEDVYQRADAHLIVPMHPGRRSLNVAMTTAMVLAEALRQTSGFPSNNAQ